ncbi:hypothetical protein AB9G92_27585 [Escherichia coli]|uniref:hypothetical protein n=1 Tax=Escherichia coli TaxID=562 RepID=UPI003516E063
MGGHEKPWGNSYAAMNYLKHHFNPYMREPIEHGDLLSDKEKIKTIITNTINSFDIQFAENMLKAQSRSYRYKK